MNRGEAREAIERLRGVPDNCSYTSAVAGAFLGRVDDITFTRDVREFRDALIEVLEFANPPEMTDSELAKYGLMRLPKDADGVPVRLGDVMSYKDSTFTVEAVGHDMLYFDYDSGDVMLDDVIGYDECRASVCHHLTVEGILSDLVDSLIGDNKVDGDTKNILVARYADKIKEIKNDQEA